MSAMLFGHNQIVATYDIAKLRIFFETLSIRCKDNVGYVQKSGTPTLKFIKALRIGIKKSETTRLSGSLDFAFF